MHRMAMRSDHQHFGRADGIGIVLLAKLLHPPAAVLRKWQERKSGNGQCLGAEMAALI
jgi:hypothetical protein